jgi:hypothetical protein
LISFRYHLVSISAVFLALALGIVVGTTVVNQGIIDDLRNRTDSVTQNAENLRKQVEDLQGKLAVTQTFESAILPVLVQDQLPGTEITLVAQADVDVAAVESVRRVLEEAGASVVAEVVVTNRMALADDRSRSDLASALGTVDSAIAEQLAQEAATALAARLAAGPSTDGTDLLDSLHSAGFVVIRGGSSTTTIGGPTQAVVLLAGSDRESGLDPALFLAPLATALVNEQHPVVAAETQDSVVPFVLLLRDGDVDGQLVTVDNADQTPGKVALVYGLRDLLASPGSGGDYGVKTGASSLIPRPQP